tara:strand:+ start:5616 stop:5843 length:228 start_codon:yes stop_codon:yes gene_type:complete
LDTDRLTYTRDRSDGREASKIEFDVPADLTIEEYHTICVRMAHALGYHHKSISSKFGKEANPNAEISNQLKLLFG